MSRSCLGRGGREVSPEVTQALASEPTCVLWGWGAQAEKRFRGGGFHVENFIPVVVVGSSVLLSVSLRS